VATFVARLRREENSKKPQPPSATGEPMYAPQGGEVEHAALAQLWDVHPDVGIAAAFTERFVEIVRERRGNKLGGWLSDAEASGIREIQQFAYKVRRDETAVEAGCTLP
jgi:hypothetical protein